MDADVGLAGEQRGLDPAHEAALVAGLAVGGDLDELGSAEQAGDPLGLGERQGAPPGREAKRHAAPLAGLAAPELGHFGPALGLRLGLGVETEQLAQRADVEVGVVVAGGALHPQGRLVQ